MGATLGTQRRGLSLLFDHPRRVLAVKMVPFSPPPTRIIAIRKLSISGSLRRGWSTFAENEDRKQDSLGPSIDSNLITKDLALSASLRPNDFNGLKFGSPSWTRFELWQREAGHIVLEMATLEPRTKECVTM